MLIYTLKRILLALLVAILVSAIGFGFLFLSGDPAVTIAGESASSEDIKYIREFYGFDRPIVVQYVSWLGKAVQGDFGKSYYFKLPVSQILGDRLPVTLTLGACSLAFALILSIPLGMVAAIRPNSWIDRLALLLSVMGQAMPTFWFGLMLVVLLSVWFPLLPASGTASWKNFVMPTIVLGYFAMPALMRLTRAGMIEVLSSDYIRTARAKGLLANSVFFKHALRNALMPVVS